MLGGREMARKNGEGCRVVGATAKYKYDKKLFRRYTRNASERKVTEYQLLMTVLSWQQRDLAQKAEH